MSPQKIKISAEHGTVQVPAGSPVQAKRVKYPVQSWLSIFSVRVNVICL